MIDHRDGRSFAHSLTSGGNAVLAQLSSADLSVIAQFGERCYFVRGEIIVNAHATASRAYFVEEGIVSVVKPERGGRRTEVCLIGRDSVLSAAVFQGDAQSPYETFVQSDRVVAIGIDTTTARSLFDGSQGFRSVVLHALYVQSVQVAENLVSAASQTIQARLARWLLMYHDRSASAFLELTHEFMAVMIGAQRARVTVALHELEAAGGISASRGRIVLKERATLMRMADGTYGCAELEAARLRQMGAPT